MMTAILAAISFASFLLLLLLGMKLVHEEGRRPVNRLFTAFTFWIAGICFCEFMARLSGDRDAAEFWAYCASSWPFASALLFHSLLLILNRRDRFHRVLPWVLYLAAAGMSLGYIGFVSSGGAVVRHYGYSLVSPDPRTTPFGITTVMQTLIMVGMVLLLIRHSWNGGRETLHRRDLRWILSAYLAYLIVMFGSAMLGLPEMTGLGYLVFGGIIYLGIHTGHLIVLTPQSASRQIAGSISEVMLLTDPDYRILSTNPYALAFFNLPEKELVGSLITDCEEVGPNPDGRELLSADGRRTVRVRDIPITSRGGVFVGRLLLGRDITDEKRHHQLLEESLQEKESMLHEIHHRVFNILQLIASILRLKSEGLTDPEGVVVLDECNSKIRNIAAIYEIVLDDQHHARIQFDQLIRLQVERTIAQLGSTIRIRAEYDLQGMEIDLQTSVSVSLILSELISNSLRHAFPTGAGRIRLGIEIMPAGGWELSVTDDGCGFDLLHTRRSGLEIAEELCRQLDTSLKIESTEEGTRVSFSIARGQSA